MFTAADEVRLLAAFEVAVADVEIRPLAAVHADAAVAELVVVTDPAAVADPVAVAMPEDEADDAVPVDEADDEAPVDRSPGRYANSIAELAFGFCETPMSDLR